MAEKMIKKFNFFTSKRSTHNSENGNSTSVSPAVPEFTDFKKESKKRKPPNLVIVKNDIESRSSPATPISPTHLGLFQNNRRPSQSPSPVTNRATNSNMDKPRRPSAGGIKELVLCPLCLEVLHNPKMLPCQHTFCMACLVVYANNSRDMKCPTCKKQTEVKNEDFINELPSNLYIDSLLELVANNNDALVPATSQSTPSTSRSGMNSVDLLAGGTRCVNCRTVCDNSDVTCCKHCRQNLCGVCWSQHLEDMQIQIGSILKQVESAEDRLNHKIEYYRDRCERLEEQINQTAEERISLIVEQKHTLLQEAESLRQAGEMAALALKTSLTEAKDVSLKSMKDNDTATDKQKVSIFINLHRNALQLISDVSKWDTDHFVFDKENFKIELDAATPLDAESDDPVPGVTKDNDPLENEDNLATYYRSRNFVPHYVWKKISHPIGLGLNPWNNHLYICGLDTRSVSVVERTQCKIVSKLMSEELLYPVQIAFMKSLGEIYVTDKWKHCIHVFSKDGEYLRNFGQKGSRTGMFRSPEGIATDNANLQLYVVDTGNDRVQILQPDGKYIDQIGVTVRKQPTPNTGTVWDNKNMTCTELSAPTSVAVTNDRIIILDSGNRRVKIYNKQDRSKILEFGSVGHRKGQFRQPEALAVDPLGFILVGDSGNSRVQVFKPNGQLVRVFGGLGSAPGKFSWISAIHVTKQLDIIISDTKNHCVNFIKVK